MFITDSIRNGRLCLIKADIDGLLECSEPGRKPNSAPGSTWNGAADMWVGRMIGPGGTVPAYEQEYYMVPNVNMLREMVHEGKHQAADVAFIQDMSRDLADPMPVDQRRVVRMRDEGEEIDSDRFFSQDYDHMYRQSHRTNKRTGTKVVEIGFAWGGHCGRTREQLFASGAIGVALANKLEEVGYSVNIRAICAVRNGNKRMIIEVPIKTAGEPLNIEVITALACHGGVFRWYGINTFAFHPEFDPGAHMAFETDWGDAEADITALADAGLMVEPDIIMPRMMNKAAAKRFVEDAMRELIEAEEELL